MRRVGVRVVQTGNECSILTHLATECYLFSEITLKADDVSQFTRYAEEPLLFKAMIVDYMSKLAVCHLQCSRLHVSKVYIRHEG